MSLNATLLVQMLTFGLFVLFTMKMVWPHITESLEERKRAISEGLVAAEKSKRDLEFAKRSIVEKTREAKAEATQIIELANKRASRIIDDANNKARQEGARLLELAQSDIAKEVESAKIELRQRIGLLAINGAEQILSREIDDAANQAIIDKLIDEI